MSISWRGINIEKWAPLLRSEDVAKTPLAVLDCLCSIGLPIRVYVKNVLNLCGILERIWQNGQFYIQIKMLNVAAERRGRDEKIEKIQEILFDKDISLELPVFE